MGNSKNIKILKGQIFKGINQWVEIFFNDEYQTKMLVGVNQTNDDIIEEYYNQIKCSQDEKL